MKKHNDVYIIGIDHGYGNIKTANCCFPTGLIADDVEPVFNSDVLCWNDKYYSIGVGHKEFVADKHTDDDYYVLTLAAIARELHRERITNAKVFIAAGLPLTWVSQQKQEYKEYLLQNKRVVFTFRKVEYDITIVGADVFPQGFSAIANMLNELNGVNMLCDIGNGTMNLLKVINKKPDPQQMFTEKYGTYQCTLRIREQMMKLHHTDVDDAIITNILKTGTAEIDEKYLDTITSVAREYTKGIFKRLYEHGYDSKLMKLFVVGGGGCLIKNFADYDDSRVIISDDICATAKGYEYMAMITLNR